MKKLQNKRINNIIKAKILRHFENLCKSYEPDYIGNNLNNFLFSSKIDKLILRGIKKFSKLSTRKIRAKMDVLRGEIFEDVVKFLLNKYFEKHKNYNHIQVIKEKECREYPYVKELIEKLSLKRKNIEPVKKPDIDLVVFSKKIKHKLFLISIKGTARERIGQFLSNLFIFDKRVLEIKYNDLYLLSPPLFKLSFVCLDLAKNKDFSDENKEKIERKTKRATKQIEVYLIYDDEYLSGGIYVLNNLPKLQKVGNFSELIGRIVKFFDEQFI